MNRYIGKMLRRSIRASLGRYLAILAIVALGVGFFAGLKSSMPAMLATADEYLRAQRLPDFRLLSTLGFTGEDVAALEDVPGVESAEGAYFADAAADFGGGRAVYHFQSLTERVAVPSLTAGRWPAAPGECLGDEKAFRESDLGKTIMLEEDNDADTLALFSRRSYTLVGLARSPRYISDDRGSTSLGSGRIAGFVILPRSGFSSPAYHEVLLWCALSGEIYSEEYNAARDRLADTVKEALNRRGALRRAALYDEALREMERAELALDQGWEKLAEGRQAAAEELARAEQELADARLALDRGWAEVNANQKKLDDAMAAIPAARRDIADGRRQIEEGRARLAEGQAQIDAGRAEIERRRAEAAAGQEEIDAGWAELEANESQVKQYRALFDEARAALQEREGELRELLRSSEAARYAYLAPYVQAVLTAEGEVYVLQGRVSALEPGGESDELTALRQQLAAAEEKLAAARTALTEAEESYDPDDAGIVEVEDVIARLNAYADELEGQLAEAEQALADGRQQFLDAQAELDAGLQQLDAAAAELDSKEAEVLDGVRELDESEAALASASAQLDALERDYPANQRKISRARTKLNDGEAELADGRAEYEQGKADAEAELSEAAEKLRDGARELSEERRKLDDRLALEVYALDRSANSGYVTFENDTGIIDAIANAFPIFFALIAALVCVTTMTRMVNDERTLIGTMKALGYSAGAIMSKYLLYAGSSALFGCVAGFFLGTFAIPRVIFLAYSIMYTYAGLRYYFDLRMYLTCLAVAVPCALLVTFLACRRELAGKPAELMRPKAPGKGKRIVLERLPFVWKRLPFLSKVTLRNAFRHRSRVLMMLLGIGGCTALMVAGFGARDSVANISAYQYEEIFLYDLTVTLDTETIPSDDAAVALWQDECDRAALTWQEAVTLLAHGREKTTRVVAARAGEIETVLSLHNAAGAVTYPGPGEAVITQKLSDRLGLSAGDTATLRLDDGRERIVRITAVCDNYLNHYIFVCPETVEASRGNTALLHAAEGVEPGRLAARLRSAEGVNYVSAAAQEREIMEQSMASLDLLVVMLIVCSGVLAFITLYNLTNINIMERTREIATVKVLGFFPGETAAYILRENLLLSFLGGAVGLGLGKLLHRFVMELVDVENMTVDIRIQLTSYLWSFLITLVFAALTNAVMRRKLEKVDMAESLKSVE